MKRSIFFIIVSIFIGIMISGCTESGISPEAKSYSVTYDENEATSGSVPVDNNDYSKGDPVTVLGNTGSLVRTGYYFAGWNRNSSGTGSNYSAGMTFTIEDADVVLYANWSSVPVYTVSFVTNGGSSVSEQLVPENGKVTEPLTPTKPGHTFENWYSDAGFTTLWNFTTDTVIGDMSLYAKWTINTYTVDFDSNGGSAVSSQTIDYDSTVSEPTDPTKADYIFSGWYSDSDFTSVWDFASDTVTEDMTLYAKWVYDFSAVSYREMIEISGGTYTQTDGTDSFSHQIGTFYMGRYEVTHELWYEVYEWATANGYNFQNVGVAGEFGSSGYLGGDWHEPVTTINWRDAIVWCNAYSEMEVRTPCYTYGGAVIRDSRHANLTACDGAECDWSADGYRLLSEGEWQYAASEGGTISNNYASDATDDSSNSAATGYVAWFIHNSDTGSGNQTHDVGTRPGSTGYGSYDLSGNVREWCWDWYGAYPTDSQTDYYGATGGTSRSKRGGCYCDQAYRCEVGDRDADTPPTADEYTGFRVARSQ